MDSTADKIYAHINLKIMPFVIFVDIFFTPVCEYSNQQNKEQLHSKYGQPVQDPSFDPGTDAGRIISNFLVIPIKGNEIFDVFRLRPGPINFNSASFSLNMPQH